MFSRNYFYISSGNVEVKLIPPKYTPYLDEFKDYENFDFLSPINIWNTQNKYFKNKIKTILIVIFKPTSTRLFAAQNFHI